MGLLALPALPSTTDHKMLSVPMQPIKKEPDAAFTVFHATAVSFLRDGPMGGNRPLILGVRLAGRSLATAACGFAPHPAQLALARTARWSGFRSGWIIGA